ncbi:MAG: DUF4236 domain-containing protein [Anaerolineae bacterium]|nr:DUF4236 domain-containing protein [Anaerolineae bacterium]
MFTGFRFRREIDVLPWLQFNISKTGVSATVGPDDLHVTVGSHGTYVYSDLPGKGTYFRRKWEPMMDDLTGEDEEEHESQESDEEGENPTESEAIIEQGFFERIISVPEESAFVDAVRALDEGDMETAYMKAKWAASHADGAFLAGFLAMQNQDWQLAVEYFERCLEDREHLGEWFAKFELTLNIFVPVSEDFVASIQPHRRDCLLALASAHERMEHNEQAIDYLQQIREEYDPDDLLVRLLRAELLDETHPQHPRVQHEIVVLAEGVQNDSPIHAALMYYRGRALRRLDVLDGARDTFTKALRKKKDYPSDLLVALRYERALLYEEEGDESRAHEEFEKIYAMAPELEDVAERLGLTPEINQEPPPGALQDEAPSDEKPGQDASVDFELEDTQTQE